MTPGALSAALATGVERLAAWADLLDAINVYPVADGDTGRNLVVSLTPLRRPAPEGGLGSKAGELLVAARGNSGNIAGRFFAAFLSVDPADGLAHPAARGAAAARAAVRHPQPGTMLTVLDSLAGLLGRAVPLEPAAVEALLAALAATVRDGVNRLPRLARAGVVDAGALGMYVLFEGLLRHLVDRLGACRPPTETFAGLLEVRGDFQEETTREYCIDAVIRSTAGDDRLAALLGEAHSLVTARQDGLLKVHLHTADSQAVKARLAAAGPLVAWDEDDLAAQVRAFAHPAVGGGVHLATDAAASLGRDDRQRTGITLLDSYVTAGTLSRPETRWDPREVYAAMRRGERVTTSQSSDYERRETYQRLAAQHGRVLYLCVGSVYTGNYRTAREWQAQNDRQGGFHVLDTGAASGRLAVIALVTAAAVARGADLAGALATARRAMEASDELIFLDRLKWLAAGGRISRPQAFLGDAIGLRPVVTPRPEGVARVGAVRRRRDQLRLALERLGASIAPGIRSLILLQYTDNEAWVRETAAPAVTRRHPEAEVRLQALSLTTGAHTGPGTWAIAWCRPNHKDGTQD
jgi:DegV family protein with EDD domain